MSAYADSIARQERAKAYAAQAHDPIICPKCDGNLDTGFECLGCGYDAAPVTQPATSQEGEAVEALAQFLHDEGGFGDAMTDRTWPDHADDTGQREGGWVKIVPADVQAHFRDVARRWLGSRLAATPTPPTLSEDLGDRDELGSAAFELLTLGYAKATAWHKHGIAWDHLERISQDELIEESRAALARAQVKA